MGAFLDGAPAFLFSKFPTLSEQDILVSFPTFLRLTEGKYTSVDELPMGRFFIQFDTSITDTSLNSVKRDLSDLIKGSEYSLHIYDYRSSLEIIGEIDIAMQFFFGFTVIMAMAISFFSLVSSMYTNVYEQAKEIGVLRAIGMPFGWMQRVYVFEAFTLVFSASIMGMIIGVTVGWTVSIQRVLFTQLPVPFTFPIELFVIIFIMSVIFSIISSYSPITAIMRKPIVSILRQ